MNSLNVQMRWKRPQLTVLVRNQPQEQILSACKGSGIGVGPNEIGDVQCEDRTSMTCDGCLQVSLS